MCLAQGYPYSVDRDFSVWPWFWGALALWIGFSVSQPPGFTPWTVAAGLAALSTVALLVLGIVQAVRRHREKEALVGQPGAALAAQPVSASAADRGKLFLRKALSLFAGLFASALYIAALAFMFHAGANKTSLDVWQSGGLAAAGFILGSAVALAAFLMWPHSEADSDDST